MLIFKFLNDGTGDEIEGNYNWEVFINSRCIGRGSLNGFNRMKGWEGLARLFGKNLEKVEGKVVKTIRDSEGELKFEVKKEE